MAAHHGSVSVQSHPGQTTFTIVLPAGDQADVQAAGRVTEADGPRGRRVTEADGPSACKAGRTARGAAAPERAVPPPAIPRTTSTVSARRHIPDSRFGSRGEALSLVTAPATIQRGG